MAGARGQSVSHPVQDAFDKINDRRVALIARKHTPGVKLTPEQTRELAALEPRCLAVVNALFPLPSLEERAKLLGLPVPDKHVDERQLEMLYACAPPDCAWCGEAHEGGPEHCASPFCEDNQREPEGAAGAENRLGCRSGPS